MSVVDQLKALNRKIRGHCAYYGITGNAVALEKYRRGVRDLWRKWLKRRSGAAMRKNWDWWDRFFKKARDWPRLLECEGTRIEQRSS